MRINQNLAPDLLSYLPQNPSSEPASDEPLSFFASLLRSATSPVPIWFIILSGIAIFLRFTCEGVLRALAVVFRRPGRPLFFSGPRNLNASINHTDTSGPSPVHLKGPPLRPPPRGQYTWFWAWIDNNIWFNSTKKRTVLTLWVLGRWWWCMPAQPWNLNRQYCSPRMQWGFFVQ